MNSILEILKEKAAQGVEIKLLYDDIGCKGDLQEIIRNFMSLGLMAMFNTKVDSAYDGGLQQPRSS